MGYLKNLWAALCGRTASLDEVKKLRKEVQRVHDYQSLTENLRQRTIELEERLKDERSDHNKTLDRLQDANQQLARECMAKSMLEKTNSNLADLAAAMQDGDEEKMKMAVEYLGWCDPLARIAQRHLNLLRLYHESLERAAS